MLTTINETIRALIVNVERSAYETEQAAQFPETDAIHAIIPIKKARREVKILSRVGCQTIAELAGELSHDALPALQGLFDDGHSMRAVNPSRSRKPGAFTSLKYAA